MAPDTDTIERTLATDLAGLDDRIAEDRFARELYQALTNNEWRKDGLDGAIALSWNLAARLVDDLRARIDKPALALAQTGGEGEVAPAVAAALGELGWTHRPVDTSHDDPRHVSEAAQGAPPADQGARHVHGTSTEERFHEAHEEAEYNRLVPPGEAEPGTTADKLGRKG